MWRSTDRGLGNTGEAHLVWLVYSDGHAVHVSFESPTNMIFYVSSCVPLRIPIVGVLQVCQWNSLPCCKRSMPVSLPNMSKALWVLWFKIECHIYRFFLPSRGIACFRLDQVRISTPLESYCGMSLNITSVNSLKNYGTLVQNDPKRF